MLSPTCSYPESREAIGFDGPQGFEDQLFIPGASMVAQPLFVTFPFSVFYIVSQETNFL